MNIFKRGRKYSAWEIEDMLREIKTTIEYVTESTTNKNTRARNTRRLAHLRWISMILMRKLGKY